MQQQVSDHCQILFDETLLKEKEVFECLDVSYWQEKQAIVGSAKGRSTTWFVQTQMLTAALRHYCRGGVIGRFIRDHYLFLGWEKTRSSREFLLLRHLAENEIPVPRPLAARAVKRGLFYQADLLVEKIKNTQSLVGFLKLNELDAKNYYQIGRMIRKLHNLNVYHADLNINNILIDEAGKFWLIDFDKCAVQKGERWKQSNLKRLLRSFKKEQARHDILWQEKDWQALLVGYES